MLPQFVDFELESKTKLGTNLTQVNGQVVWFIGPRQVLREILRDQSAQSIRCQIVWRTYVLDPKYTFLD